MPLPNPSPSHLILELYQDSDLPLTSREGTDTKAHAPPPHFITLSRAEVARQTIPLPRSQQPGDGNIAALCPFEHPPSIRQHSCTYVSAYIMNSLMPARPHSAFTLRKKATAITLSSFLQLNADQLMTKNETLREIHTGI